MSEEKAASTLGGSSAKKTGENIILTVEALQSLVTAAVKAAVADTNNNLASALEKWSPRYKSPEERQNEDTIREQTRELAERIRKDREASQSTCPHLQGSNSLSNWQGTATSFIWHTLDTGLVVMICTNCGKTIFADTADPEERAWFKRKPGNVMSAAGQRFFRNYEAAQKKGKLQSTPSPLPSDPVKV